VALKPLLKRASETRRRACVAWRSSCVSSLALRSACATATSGLTSIVGASAGATTASGWSGRRFSRRRSAASARSRSSFAPSSDARERSSASSLCRRSFSPIFPTSKRPVLSVYSVSFTAALEVALASATSATCRSKNAVAVLVARSSRDSRYCRSAIDMKSSCSREAHSLVRGLNRSCSRPTLNGVVCQNCVVELALNWSMRLTPEEKTSRLPVIGSSCEAITPSVDAFCFRR
jgi:hypothetical protein